jgi:Brp/Blh family beta-carotene 15,15'-monooxygenase
MQIKLRLYLILFAFFLFLLDWVFVLTNSTQISFLILVLILFGVPHGALDLYIDQHLRKSESNQKIFLLKYIGNIIAYAFVWYFFPIAALVIFILITAYHFGEIDWMGKTEKIIHKIAYSVIGLLWILFLLSKNVNFALEVFMRMERSAFNEKQWIHLANKIYPITLIGLFAVHAVLFFFKGLFFSKNKYYYYLIIQQLTLIVFALFMPLWLCFAFYFGFWHSLLSFDKIRITFDMPNNFTGWKDLLIKAAPFSIMAWFGFAYITLSTLNSKDASGIFTLLFISLSVLALPHLQIFTKIKLKED